jgi:hypothetical protein
MMGAASTDVLNKNGSPRRDDRLPGTTIRPRASGATRR